MNVTILTCGNCQSHAVHSVPNGTSREALPAERNTARKPDLLVAEPAQALCGKRILSGMTNGMLKWWVPTDSEVTCKGCLRWIDLPIESGPIG